MVSSSLARIYKEILSKNKKANWLRKVIPILRRQRQAALCEFETSLVYRVSSRTARGTHRETLYQTKKKESSQV